MDDNHTSSTKSQKEHEKAPKIVIFFFCLLKRKTLDIIIIIMIIVSLLFLLSRSSFQNSFPIRWLNKWTAWIKCVGGEEGSYSVVNVMSPNYTPPTPDQPETCTLKFQARSYLYSLFYPFFRRSVYALHYNSYLVSVYRVSEQFFSAGTKHCFLRQALGIFEVIQVKWSFLTLCCYYSNDPLRQRVWDTLY